MVTVVQRNFDLPLNVAEDLRLAAFEDRTSQVRIVTVALREWLDRRAKKKEPVALDEHLQEPLTLDETELDQGGCPGPLGIRVVENAGIPEGSALMTAGPRPEQNVVIKNTSADVENPFD